MVSAQYKVIFRWVRYLYITNFLQAVTRVLSCQPDNAKALYRKARILSAMGRTSEALEAARAAASAAPGDSGVRKELTKCEQKASRDRSVERRLAQRMLGGVAAPSSSPDKKPSNTKVIYSLIKDKPNKGFCNNLYKKMYLKMHFWLWELFYILMKKQNFFLLFLLLKCIYFLTFIKGV